MDIKAVLFDAGGTLIHPQPSMEQIYASVLTTLGVKVPPDEFAMILRLTIKDYRLRARGGRAPYLPISEDEDKGMWKAIITDLTVGVPALKDVDVDAWAERLYQTLSDPRAWAVYPDAAEVVPKLAGAGFMLGVVSNWNPHLTKILADHGLARHFKTVTVSTLAGVQKPDPQIFQKALQEIGVGPEASIFVGNNYEDDIVGACTAGIRAALLQRNGDRSSQGITDLRELLPHLMPAE